MTAQKGDIFRYQNKKYSIVALSSNENLFDPRNYGLESHMSSTACYRGYWSEYTVINGKMVLNHLYLYNCDGIYPPLNGIEVSPPEFVECYSCSPNNLEDKKKAIIPAHLGHQVYRDVNIPILYTGKILLGYDFMSKYYIHMGFQRGWAYKELIELVFSEGAFIGNTDFSHIAKAQRKAIKNNKNFQYPEEGNITHFVNDSFSLDYSVKAWWLKE